MSQSRAEFARRVLVASTLAALVVAAAYLMVKLSLVVLLLFAAILLAVFLDGLARFVTRHTRLPRRASLAVVVVLLVGILVFLGWFYGPKFTEQFGQLSQRVDEAVQSVEGWLQQREWGRSLLERTGEPQQVLASGSGIVGSVAGIFSTAVGWLFNVVVVLFVAAYLSISPQFYVDNLVRLVTDEHRRRAGEVMSQLGESLRWWLVGRFASMAAVGVLTIIGLLVIGMPLPVILGIIAGLLSFVPFIGPIASAVPAILVAMVDGWTMVLYVVIVYQVVQLIEGNLITPLIQKRAVHMPPALLISGQLAMGVVFGPLGVLLATPLLVVVIVIVQMLYVEDVLHDEVSVMGGH